jgi:hypothetical protein
MSADKKGLSVKEARHARDDAFVPALNAFSSNLVGLLVTDKADTRFLKLLYREDGSWLAIAGSCDQDEEPIVCFGNGGDALSALYSLGRAMAADEWREDVYAKRE